MRRAVFVPLVAGLLCLAAVPVLGENPVPTAAAAVYSAAPSGQAAVTPVRWYTTRAYPGWYGSYYAYPGYSTYYYPAPVTPVYPYTDGAVYGSYYGGPYYYAPYRYSWRGPGWIY
jgi:hypothetical protein